MKDEFKTISALLRFTLFAFAVAFVGARIYLKLVDTYSPANQHWTRTRLRKITEAIDKLPTEAPPVNVVFGASEVEVGINPVSIDEKLSQAGIEAKTYNFGIRNATGYHLELLTDRLAIAMNREKDKVDFGILIFTPLRNTKRFSKEVSEYGNFGSVSTYSSLIYTPQMLAQRWWPPRADVISSAVLKYGFGSMSPFSALDELDEFIRLWTNYYFDKAEVFNVALMKHALWMNPMFYQGQPWDPATRGRYFFGYPETSEKLTPFLKAYENPDVLLLSNNIDVAYGGGLYFDFDPTLLGNFTQAIHNVSSVSRHTLLVYYPELLGYLSPHGARSIAMALQNLARSTNAVLLDYTACNVFTKADYFDGTHLNLNGQEKLSKLLAEDMAELSLPRPRHAVPSCIAKK